MPGTGRISASFWRHLFSFICILTAVLFFLFPKDAFQRFGITSGNQESTETKTIETKSLDKTYEDPETDINKLPSAIIVNYTKKN